MGSAMMASLSPPPHSRRRRAIPPPGPLLWIHLRWATRRAKGRGYEGEERGHGTAISLDRCPLSFILGNRHVPRLGGEFHEDGEKQIPVSQRRFSNLTLGGTLVP
jgi:hypothetical protein